MARDDDRRLEPLDRATRTIFQPDRADDAANECRETIAELCALFSEAAVLRSIDDLGISPQRGAAVSPTTHEDVLQALRGFAVLVIESSRPRLTAQLVGKLSGLETATGKRLNYRELGKPYGISKQAVSKLLASYADRLGLDRPDSGEDARASHRLMNRRNYQTRKPPAVPAL